MPKPNSQQGKRPKQLFTLRLNWVLANKVRDLAEIEQCSIISIFEDALWAYFKD